MFIIATPEKEIYCRIGRIGLMFTENSIHKQRLLLLTNFQSIRVEGNWNKYKTGLQQLLLSNPFYSVSKFNYIIYTHKNICCL